MLLDSNLILHLEETNRTAALPIKMILQHHLNQETKKVFFYLKITNEFTNVKCKTNHCFVYLELFTFSGARTNDTKRNVSAFDTGNTSDQKETSLQNQVIKIGTFLSCSHGIYLYFFKIIVNEGLKNFRDTIYLAGTW